MSRLNFCPECGTALRGHEIAGELRNHAFCPHCAVPRYDHPMVVVTCFVACGRRLLWVQRDIEPKRGLWAIPGGYVEGGETLAAGAARELREEAGVDLSADQLQFYMTGTITFIHQVYVGFRATVNSDACAPGIESQDCGFFSREECPWDQLAYPQVNSTIVQAYDDLDSGRFSVWQAELTQGRYDFRTVSQ